MEIAAQQPHTLNTLLMELAGVNGQQGNEAEGLVLPEELTQQEGLKELPPQLGNLKGEGGQRTFFFAKMESSPLTAKSVDYLSTVNPPKEKKQFELKKEWTPSPALKEKWGSEKEFSVLKLSEQPGPVKEETAKQERPPLFVRTHATAQHTLEKGVLLTPTAQPSAFKQQESQAKTLERKVHTELTREREKMETGERKKTEPQSVKEQKRPLEKEATKEALRLDEKREPEAPQKSEKERRQEEEGFAEGERQFQQEEEQEENDFGYSKVASVGKIDAPYLAAFNTFMGEGDSFLSEIFDMRVTKFDVLLLCIEILKLDIKSKEQESIARQQERQLQIMHMEKVVANYKSQGKWLMFSSIGSGVLAIVSGICPVLGHMKGGAWLQEKLGSIFSSMRDMPTQQLFKSITKITLSMSEMQKSTGQIHNMFADGDKAYDQHMSELYRADEDQSSRKLEDIKENFRRLQQFMEQFLQMDHDVTRQLYN